MQESEAAKVTPKLMPKSTLSMGSSSSLRGSFQSKRSKILTNYNEDAQALLDATLKGRLEEIKELLDKTTFDLTTLSVCYHY